MEYMFISYFTTYNDDNFTTAIGANYCVFNDYVKKNP